MISQKFSAIPESELTCYLSGNDNQKEDDSILDAIERIPDLWVLAKMKETYNEETYLHSGIADNASRVFPPI